MCLRLDAFRKVPQRGFYCDLPVAMIDNWVNSIEVISKLLLCFIEGVDLGDNVPVKCEFPPVFPFMCCRCEIHDASAIASRSGRKASLVSEASAAAASLLGPGVAVSTARRKYASS